MYIMVKIALLRHGMSMSELARKIGTSVQNLNQRLRRGSLRLDELKMVAEAMGAELCCSIRFPDGTEIKWDGE